MIEKLYDLKKNQTDQKLMQKAQLESKIEKINIEITLTQNNIATSTVERHGAISDFMILTMHKNTMRMHVQKLNIEKNSLNSQIENIVKEIMELQKKQSNLLIFLKKRKKKN